MKTEAAKKNVPAIRNGGGEEKRARHEKQRRKKSVPALVIRIERLSGTGGQTE